MNRSVIVIGAGVGLESVVAGHRCRELLINDMSSIALALCSRKLCRNGIRQFAAIPGAYESIDLPRVDLIIGSFLVYDRGTLGSMRRLFAGCDVPVLLPMTPRPSSMNF